MITAELIKNLRAKAWQSSRPTKGSMAYDHICWKAADEIERLQSRISVLEAERKLEMNTWNESLDRIYAIISETTSQWRKQEVLRGTPELVEQAKRGEDLKGGGVLEVYDMPHVSEAPAGWELVDMEFIVVGVDKAAAERNRDELIDILKSYPQPERLRDGPSYIEFGAAVGDQGVALRLFALGKILGVWDVITPMKIGLTTNPVDARELAELGFVMITGFQAK